MNVSSVATRGLNRVPYAAAKGGSTRSPRLSRSSWHHTGSGSSPPHRGHRRAAATDPRGPAPQGEQERGWYATIVEQTTASSLMKRYGTLDEQAAALTFLASDGASYITGTVLPVAGGDLG